MTWRTISVGRGTVPIISSSGVTGYHDEAKAKGPGVVTGRYGTLGEVFYIEDDFWPLNTSLYVQDFKGNHPRFISYFLRTLGFAGQNVAGAVPGVNRNFLHMLKVHCPPQDSDYVYGMLRYSGFADEVKQHANGANVLHLSPERIEQFAFVLPPELLRRQYAGFASDVYSMCDALQSKNAALRRTRSLLLPRLISGELDVSGIDIDAAETSA